MEGTGAAPLPVAVLQPQLHVTSPATVVIYCTTFTFLWKPHNAIKAEGRLSFQKVSSFRALPSKHRGERPVPPNPSPEGLWDRLYLPTFIPLQEEHFSQ